MLPSRVTEKCFTPTTTDGALLSSNLLQQLECCLLLFAYFVKVTLISIYITALVFECVLNF